uniref:Secretion system C-terminal sorting domain-containing protein n=1 Tax=Ignavibacterium album TaxID=591197 RepID=A0A7V3E878_9BACT
MIKRFSFLMMLSLLFASSISFAQLVGGNTYTINGVENPPTSFASITSAAAYLGTNGVTGTGDVVLELSTGYAGEPGPVSIGLITGTSSTTRVVFRPAAGYTALTEIPGGASPNQHAIRITGSYIVLDGQAGGTGNSRNWTIRTTGTNGQMAVRLDNTSNSMTGVELRYLIMEGEAANTTGAVFQITGSTANTITNVIVENNLIRSNPLASTLRGYGVTFASASNVGNTGIIFRNNVITQFFARGINLTGGFPGIEVYGNEIYHTADVTQPTTTEFSAIYFSTTSSPGAKIHSNYIHDIRLTNGTTAINGIYIFNGNTSGAPVQYYNNRISIGGELSGTAANLSVFGLRENAVSGSLINIYYNSVYVSGTLASGANNSAAFRKQVSNFVNLKNNIFYNARTNSAGTATHWAIMSNNTAYASIGNNDYYADGTGGVLGTTDGATTGNKLTLSAWLAAVPTDGGSVSQNPNFVADLKINETIPTQLESGAVPILGITTDFEGDLRNATTPDIGADEFNGILLDLTPPIISYTPFLNTGSTSARTLVASISDLSGVPTSGIGLPVLYWKINSGGTWAGATATYLSGNNYQFSFGSGVAIGDTVFYYVVAQDNATTPNVGAYPSAGAGGFTANPPAAATPPTNPSSYLITQAALSGTYTVGLNMFNQITGRNVYFEKIVRRVLKEVDVELPAEKGEFADATETSVIPKSEKRIAEVEEVSYIPMENGQLFEGNLYVKKSENPQLSFPEGIEGVYSTLTAAISDLNLRGVGGNVVFSLVDSTYPSETFPLVINIANENTTSATKTVTIKPAASNVATISGASASGQIFKILNSYVTIDGSNSGGTDRSLTLENTSATSPQVILIGSLGTTPVTNVTVKNSIIRNGVNTSSAVIVSDGNTAGSAGYFNNITLRNNSIQKAYIGVYCNAVVGAGNGSGLLITENDLSTAGANSIRYVGVYVQGVDGAILSKNTIANFDGASGENDRGIWFATGTTNSTIEGNYIHSLNYTGTGGYGAYGAAISTGLLNANNKIINNVIYNLSGDGWNYSSILGDNVHGIYIFSAQSGISVYYNSINLYGNTLNQTSAISTGIAVGTGSIVELKNNNIVNKLGLLSATGYGSIGIFLQTASSQLSLSNYNNVFVNPTGSGVANFGQVATTGYSTLLDWQTAIMQDNNSISGNPNYVSDNDLRFQYPSPVYHAGNPVTGITTDILGVTRNATTPTIGAYENPVPPTIGWANLQWPPTDTISIGGSTTVYAQIWIDGITNQPGPGAGIQAWIGVNSSNTNPSTWTNWIPATYNVDVGNNDEYMAAIGSTLTPGTYYYASRFNIFGGNYVYGGYSSGGGGFWDGINYVSGILVVKEPLVPIWQRTVATTNLPTWFGTDTERGLAFGKTSDGTEAVNDRVFVVSRSGGVFVRILDAATGNDVGTLNTTGISGGTFALNDIGVTEDGKIIGANLTTNASLTAFKFYIWNNETSVPDTLFTYLGDAVRLGDKFTVVGNYSAGTAEIWAASATTGQHKVYKWTMSGGLFNPVPQVIQCSDNLTSAISNAAVGPLPNGDFYWNANGQNARKYQANGTLIGIISTSIVGTGSNAIRYLGTVGSDEYVAVFTYGTGNNNVKVLKIPNGNPTAAVLYGATPTMGAVTNSSGSGDVDFQFNNDLTVNIFALTTNNGLGAYRTDANIPVELTNFVANVVDRDVLLNWSTATEINNLGFEVERKASDNGSWSKLAFIKSAGTTTEPQQYSYKDSRLESGKYSYRLKIVDLDGTYSYSDVVEVEIGIPNQYALSQNYPNPFNPTTRIDYQLPFDAKVQIELYSITGEKVATLVNGDFSAGYHTYELNASRLNLSSGVYFYRISATDFSNGKFVDTKKLVLLK